MWPSGLQRDVSRAARVTSGVPVSWCTCEESSSGSALASRWLPGLTAESRTSTHFGCPRWAPSCRRGSQSPVPSCPAPVRSCLFNVHVTLFIKKKCSITNNPLKLKEKSKRYDGAPGKRNASLALDPREPATRPPQPGNRKAAASAWSGAGSGLQGLPCSTGSSLAGIPTCQLPASHSKAA